MSGMREACGRPGQRCDRPAAATRLPLNGTPHGGSAAALGRAAQLNVPRSDTSGREVPMILEIDSTITDRSSKRPRGPPRGPGLTVARGRLGGGQRGSARQRASPDATWPTAMSCRGDAGLAVAPRSRRGSARTPPGQSPGSPSLRPVHRPRSRLRRLRVGRAGPRGDQHGPPPLTVLNRRPTRRARLVLTVAAGYCVHHPGPRLSPGRAGWSRLGPLCRARTSGATPDKPQPGRSAPRTPRGVQHVQHALGGPSVVRCAFLPGVRHVGDGPGIVASAAGPRHAARCRPCRSSGPGPLHQRRIWFGQGHAFGLFSPPTNPNTSYPCPHQLRQDIPPVLPGHPADQCAANQMAPPGPPP